MQKLKRLDLHGCSTCKHAEHIYSKHAQLQNLDELKKTFVHFFL